MLALHACLLIAGAPGGVAVQLQQVGELELRTALELAAQLTDRVQARVEGPAKLEDPTWACEPSEDCAAQLRARTGAGEVLLLRMFGGPATILVQAERVAGAGQPPLRAEARLPFAREGWPELLGELAARLFEAPPPPLAELTRAAPAPASPRILPWVLFGSGVAAGVAGAAFGASSRSAAREIERGVLLGDRHQALADRQQSHGLTADVLFGAAVLALAGGACSLLWP